MADWTTHIAEIPLQNLTQEQIAFLYSHNAASFDNRFFVPRYTTCVARPEIYDDMMVALKGRPFKLWIAGEGEPPVSGSGLVTTRNIESHIKWEKFGTPGHEKLYEKVMNLDQALHYYQENPDQQHKIVYAYTDILLDENGTTRHYHIEKDPDGRFNLFCPQLSKSSIKELSEREVIQQIMIQSETISGTYAKLFFSDETIAKAKIELGKNFIDDSSEALNINNAQQDRKTKKEIMDLSKLAKKTLTEDFNAFRNYVSMSANITDKFEKASIFADTMVQMVNLDMKKVVDDYRKKIDERDASVIKLGSSKREILRDALKKMYFIQNSLIAGKAMAEAFGKDEQFNKYIIDDEAKTLLSGTTLYSSQVAASESQHLREQLEKSYKKIDILEEDNRMVSGKYNRLNVMFTNLVSNVKHVLGIQQNTISEFSNRHFDDISSSITSDQLEGMKQIGYVSKSEVKDEQDSSLYNRQTIETTVYAKTPDNFVIKEQTTNHGHNEYSIDTPKFREVNKAELDKIIEQLRLQDPERNKMSIGAIKHNLEAFKVNFEREQLNPKHSKGQILR